MSSDSRLILLLLHVMATVYMTGVIWFVQVVHYPLFAAVDAARFAVYEQQHSALTTFVVAPPMLAEAMTAILLFRFRPKRIPLRNLWTGLLLVLVLWLSTALIQVPCHTALEAGFDADVHLRLVRSNWLRTGAWSLRSLMVLGMLRMATRDIVLTEDESTERCGVSDE